jgi:hypothetical protein
MRDNGGLGIDWGLDGVSPAVPDDRNGPVNAPVVLSAHYSAVTNTTQVVVSVKSADVALNGQIEVFANAAADGDGEQWIGNAYVKPGNTATLSIPGNYRGKWLNATFTRIHDFDFGPWLTSEVSNAVLTD